MKRAFSIAATAALAFGLFSASAAAQPEQGFFAGKTISMVVGLSAGGDYDLRARLVARHMPRHIAGAPSMIPRNMPGAGGVAAANWLMKVAPRDGTALLAVTQNMPLAQALTLTGVEFDARQFRWIGNTTDTPNVITVWAASGARTIEDAKNKELAIAATGVGTGSYYYPLAANVVAGTKFKLVSGYPGGNEMNLAMERGEVDGRGSNSWAAWKATRPQWLEEKKIINLVQIRLRRHPDLGDVPLLQELAGNDLDRRAMALISAETAIARAFAAAPGTPDDRVQLLRRAFDATMKDPVFLQEAEQQGFDISPATGEDVQKIVAEIVDAAPEVVARVKAIVQPPK
jgi:tripartite-type tricarboxylate transporter receptor subunit TctC